MLSMKLLIALFLFVAANAQSSVAPFGQTGGTCLNDMSCTSPCDICVNGICELGPSGHYSSSLISTTSIYESDGVSCSPTFYGFSDTPPELRLAQCAVVMDANYVCVTFDGSVEAGVGISSTFETSCKFRGVGSQIGCPAYWPICGKQMQCVECALDSHCTAGNCINQVCVPYSTSDGPTSSLPLSSTDTPLSSTDDPVSSTILSTTVIPNSTAPNVSTAEPITPPDDDNTDAIVAGATLGGLFAVVIVVALIQRRNRRY